MAARTGNPFPDAPLDVTFEAAFGADPAAQPHTWTFTDLSDRLLPDPVSINRGAASGASEAAAQSGTVHLRNDDGWLTPRNPSSPWTITRSTPGRLRVYPHVSDGVDDFNRSGDTAWGVAPTGQTWAWVGTVPITVATDIVTNGAQGVHRVQAVGGFRLSYLPIVESSVELWGSVTLAAMPTGGACNVGFASRIVGTSTYLQLRARVLASGTVLAQLVKKINNVDTELAALTIPGLTYTPGTPLHLHGRVDGPDLHLNVWTGTVGAEPAGWMVSATDVSILIGGGHGVRSGVTDAATVLPDMAWDNVAVVPCTTRLAGFCDSWKPAYLPLSDGSTWSSVRVTVSGIRRRLAAQQDPPRSPIRTAAELYRSTGLLLAYWPLEDATDAKSGVNVIADSRPMTPGTLPVGWGEFNPPPGVPWSRRWGTMPLADLSNGGRLAGNVGKLGTSSPVSWAVRFLAAVYAPGFGSSIKLATIDLTGGTWARLEVNYSFGGTLQLISYLPDGTSTTIHDMGVSPTALCEYQVDAVQAGANVTIRLWATGQLFMSGSVSSVTLGRVLRVTMNPQSVVNSAASNELGRQWGAGHVQVWDTHQIPINADSRVDPDTGFNARVWQGWARESAHGRIYRLCLEQGVPALVWPVPQSDLATQMNAQPDATLLDLLSDCAKTDGGILYEDGFRLAYLPRGAMYNQAPAMTVNLGTYRVAAGDQGNVLQPVYDDTGLLNDATVSRTGGSEAQYELVAHIAAEGRYTGAREVNVQSDDVLVQHAAFDVRKGTVNELRYPDLALDLMANPDLIPAWVGCDLGMRIDRVGAPAPVHPTAAVRSMLDGYTETISPTGWSVSANCSPASPWQMGIVESSILGRADTAGSRLAEALTASGTSVRVATTSGPLWVTGNAAPTFPFDIACGGERISVSQVSQGFVTYVGAGAAVSANYAPVVPSLPAGIVAGDLLLCWAVTRNATVADAPGWTTIFGAGPTKILARIAAGSNTAPTITPTGGVSGDDVIAQVAAFRGLWFDPANIVMRLPKSGPESTQNVLTPGAIVDWDNSLILYLVFKQDDWTSIAGVGNLIGANVSTAGNDAGMAWSYQTQTSRLPVGPASWTVTGGATAVTRGAVVVIRQDAQQFTITRAAGSRAHAAGASLSLADPARIAL